ncbi:glycosyltransferase [Ramlibacter terrae]|uniref:Glycosyltransferase n=1 Tax=Ramlibacter terrae TaxID=2732511 RepID=A0ABX6P1Z5_9BURK|nr:glycosyltransferase [Ramlibacter terrae]
MNWSWWTTVRPTIPLDLLGKFARTAPFPVRIALNDRNLGCGQNFSKALSMCTGDLVFLSDQDDVWFDDKIEKMAGLASTLPDMFCFMNDAILTDTHLAPYPFTKLQQVRDHGLPDTGFVMGCCAAMRRQFLDIALPLPASVIAHDNWLLNLSDAFGRTHRHPEPLQYYRRHGANLSNVIVNKTERVGPLRLRMQKATELARRLHSGHILNSELNMYAALEERLAARGPELAPLVGQADVAAYARSVGERRSLLAARLGVRRLSRYRRPLAVAGLYRQGAYRSPSGWLSALKDLLVANP